MNERSNRALPRRSRRFALAAGTVGVAAGVAGCYEEPKITVHEPGKYKGREDNLGDAATRTAQLEQRFQQGQLDR